VNVASAASQSQVFFFVCAASRFWKNVFDFKAKVEEGFWRAAIFTSVIGLFRDRWIAGIHYSDLKGRTRPGTAAICRTLLHPEIKNTEGQMSAIPFDYLYSLSDIKESTQSF
jgi:hypothetical protein